MGLVSRIARLERGLPAPGGPCRCPRSIEFVYANDYGGAPLPVPPRRACGRCGGVVTRVEVRYESRPLPAAPPECPPGYGFQAGT